MGYSAEQPKTADPYDLLGWNRETVKATAVVLQSDKTQYIKESQKYLYLPDVMEIPTETAKVNYSFKGKSISLAMVSTIDAQTAEHLRGFTGTDIFLLGLRNIAAQNAKELFPTRKKLPVQQAVMNQIEAAKWLFLSRVFCFVSLHLHYSLALRVVFCIHRQGRC